MWRPLSLHKDLSWVSLNLNVQSDLDPGEWVYPCPVVARGDLLEQISWGKPLAPGSVQIWKFQRDKDPQLLLLRGSVVHCLSIGWGRAHGLIVSAPVSELEYRTDDDNR